MNIESKAYGLKYSHAEGVGLNDGLCVTLEKNVDLSEKEWDEAKQFGQYLLEQGEDESKE